MEQPKVYNKEEELIKWLEYDLKEQRKEIAKDRGISLNDVKEEELVLHIGNKNFKSIEKIEINFDFDFSILIKEFCKDDENVGFKINCGYLIFNKQIFFHDDINFNNILDFSASIFNNKFRIENTTFCEEVNFNSAQFNAIVDFEDVAFDKEVNFSNAIFNDEVIFEKVYFDGELYFCRTIFNKKTTFLSGLFNSVEFEEALFYDIIKFLDILFNGDVYFKEIKICNYISIDFSRINNSNIEFDNIVFKDIISGLYIKNNTGINKISIINSIINGRIDIQNLNVNTADFIGSVINGGAINPVNFKVNNFANRESALFLKNEAYARNNIIDALEYKAKEIELHKKELLKNKKDYKKWGDIFSIYISSLYSDNGLNWIKSFLYTILFTILFFTMSYNISCIPIFIIAFISLLYVLIYNKNISKRIFISAITYIIISIVFSFIYFEGYNNIDYVIKELFSFIAPTNFSQILYDKEYSSYIYDCKSNIKIICFIEIVFKGILYFLGKIAFWYGSVQTVQSFRKFSKKE